MMPSSSGSIKGRALDSWDTADAMMTVVWIYLCLMDESPLAGANRIDFRLYRGCILIIPQKEVLGAHLDQG